VIRYEKPTEVGSREAPDQALCERPASENHPLLYWQLYREQKGTV